jgi:hypothetical protein
MPTNELAIISKSQASGQTERLARVWLVAFAELYSVSLKDRGKRFVELWISAVSDLDPRAFDAACKHTVKVCKFFPMPADIRSQIDQARAKGFELEAECEWQKLLSWVREHVFPDTGVGRNAPRLSAAVEHAAKTAGGVFYIQRCSEDQLVWCRKNFLAAYSNVHDTGQVDHLLSNTEAKKILRRLFSGPTALATEKKQMGECDFD